MKLSGVSWNPSTKKDKHYESSDLVPKSSDVLVKSKGIVLIACWLMRRLMRRPITIVTGRNCNLGSLKPEISTGNQPRFSGALTGEPRRIGCRVPMLIGIGVALIPVIDTQSLVGLINQQTRASFWRFNEM